MNEHDKYEVFLEDFKPSELLEQACIPSNVNDPLVIDMLHENLSENATVERRENERGKKTMSDYEIRIRDVEFIKNKQPDWSNDFLEYVTFKGIKAKKIETYCDFFSTQWIDGKSRRQNSQIAQAIKASVHMHDQFHYGKSTQKFVLETIEKHSQPLFDREEMEIIFEANESLLEVFLSEYIEHLDNNIITTFSDLYVRRGVCMPRIGKFRIEKNYLSSYSLALGPVEQFANTCLTSKKGNKIPSIFAAPIPAIQNRTIAFAPFIPNMDIGQLELIIAPPEKETPLHYHGEYGDIHEFEFK